jgi:hypothetical protein
VAVVTATLALPFLVLDNAESAARTPDDELVSAVAPAPEGPEYLDLGLRAQAWTSARNALVDNNVELAVALAEQSRVVLEQQIGQLAAEQRSLEEARLAEAERARLAEAERVRIAEAERRAAEAAAAAAAAPNATTAPATTAAPTTTTAPPRPVGPTEPTPEQWASLRHCESRGNYQAVSSSGRFRGAYQFSQPTWDWVAGNVAPHLVGVDPASASPADQDLLAQTLYALRGRGQWPTCGRHLPS